MPGYVTIFEEERSNIFWVSTPKVINRTLTLEGGEIDKSCILDSQIPD